MWPAAIIAVLLLLVGSGELGTEAGLGGGGVGGPLLEEASKPSPWDSLLS